MKYVDNWWIELLPNGVYHLLINCTQKEIYYHSFNKFSFLISGTEEEYANWNEDVILNIEEFLPKIDMGVYVMTDTKNKSQVSFYYIPHSIGKRNIILQS